MPAIFDAARGIQLDSGATAAAQYPQAALWAQVDSNGVDPCWDANDLGLDEVLLPGGRANHEWPRPGARKQARISALSHGEPLYENFTGCAHRLWPDRPAYTITANNGQPHIHPHEDRSLSVREMARLQGFPNDFGFHGSVGEQQRQVANAVPPPMAKHIALAVRTMLDEIHGR